MKLISASWPTNRERRRRGPFLALDRQVLAAIVMERAVTSGRDEHPLIKCREEVFRFGGAAERPNQTMARTKFDVPLRAPLLANSRIVAPKMRKIQVGEVECYRGEELPGSRGDRCVHKAFFGLARSKLILYASSSNF